MKDRQLKFDHCIWQNYMKDGQFKYDYWIWQIYMKDWQLKYDHWIWQNYMKDMQLKNDQWIWEYYINVVQYKIQAIRLWDFLTFHSVAEMPKFNILLYKMYCSINKLLLLEIQWKLY